MTIKNDGGAAFPNTAFKQDDKGIVFGIGYAGMSLRDYFAAQYITGYMASTSTMRSSPEPQRMAMLAYELADAMLAARDK